MFRKIIALVLLSLCGLTFSSQPKHKKAKFLDNENLLFHAAKTGDCNTLKKLVDEYGYEPNYFYQEGVTPLIAAVCANSYKAVECLIDLNADVERKDKAQYGLTPLCWAANKSRLKMVKLLLEKYKANLEPKNERNITPLSGAIMADYSDIAKYLIDQKADLQIKDNYGNSLLDVAIMSDSYNCVKLLLDLNSESSRLSGNSVLHVGAQSNSLEILELLLKNVDVNIENDFGSTALHCAAVANKWKNISTLIKAGAKVDYKSKTNATPLMLALAEGSREAAIEFIKHKSDIKNAIIHQGFKYNKPNVAMNLLVDIMGKNYIDENRRTFLHWAAMAGKEDLAEILIDLGVPYDQRDSYDQTPKDIALTIDQAFIFKFFQIIAKHEEKLFKNERKRLAHNNLDDKLPKVLANLITEYLD